MGALARFEWARAQAVFLAPLAIAAFVLTMPLLLFVVLTGNEAAGASPYPQLVFGFLWSLLAAATTVERNQDTLTGDYWETLEPGRMRRSLTLYAIWLVPAFVQGLALTAVYLWLVKSGDLQAGFGLFAAGFAGGAVPGALLTRLALSVRGVSVAGAICMIGMLAGLRFLT